VLVQMTSPFSTSMAKMLSERRVRWRIRGTVGVFTLLTSAAGTGCASGGLIVELSFQRSLMFLTESGRGSSRLFGQAVPVRCRPSVSQSAPQPSRNERDHTHGEKSFALHPRNLEFVSIPEPTS